jgi:hypothetical protein
LNEKSIGRIEFLHALIGSVDNGGGGAIIEANADQLTVWDQLDQRPLGAKQNIVLNRKLKPNAMSAQEVKRTGIDRAQAPGRAKAV